MKLKAALMVGASLFVGTLTSHAAQFIISNVNDGLTDTLFATHNNVLMTSGDVSFGYFAAGVTSSQLNTVAGLVANLATYTDITDVTPGTPSATLGGTYAGYAEQTAFTDIGKVDATHQSALLGRQLYEIVTNNSTIAGATTSNTFAVIALNTITADAAVPNQYFGNPAGHAAVLGSLGTITGNEGGQGTGTFTTLQMTPAVPEPSAALLGAFGVLGLLRRRRN